MKKLIGLLFGLTIVIFSSQSAFAAVVSSTPPSGSTLEQRIALRKQEQKVVLDPKIQERLIKQCGGTKAKFTTITHDMEPIIDTRNSTYQKIDAKLWVLIGQLKLIPKDTFKFEQQHTDYVKKIADFQLTGTNFKQTLDDLVVMNCQADVIGFKAMLETARSYYTQLYNQSADANNYLINNVKLTINDFAKQLEPKTNTN